MFRSTVPLSLLFALWATAAVAQEAFAPAVHIPPSGKSVAASALSPAELERYVAATSTDFVFDDYLGQDAALKARNADSPALQVGVGLEIGLSAHELFEKPIEDGGYYVWSASITSAGALALRLCVDLLGFRSGEELYIADPVLPHAFGPFGAADALEEGRWLPTTEGESVLLVLRSKSPELPPLFVERLSHFFNPLLPKQQCPIDILCEGDASLQSASTAVGLMYITAPNGSTARCTGSLVNNPQTAVFEPYLLSANHCFDTGVRGPNVEVVWDYIANSCGGAAPSLSGLPRSRGERIIAASSQLDIQFLELVDVPVGTRGRTFLGWDTRAPIIGEPVTCIHHPGGATMKYAFGDVDGIENTVFGDNQTRVLWDEGITEGGSSGSPLLLNNASLALVGVLSNGNSQSCSTSTPRIDRYSSFRDFFPQIACELNSADPCDGGTKTVACGGVAQPDNRRGDIVLLFLSVLVIGLWLRRARASNSA